MLTTIAGRVGHLELTIDTDDPWRPPSLSICHGGRTIRVGGPDDARALAAALLELAGAS